jgi:hypothetical protein
VNVNFVLEFESVYSKAQESVLSIFPFLRYIAACILLICSCVKSIFLFITNSIFVVSEELAMPSTVEVNANIS